jgi:protein gp37
MPRRSGIEWTDYTFNPWWGCERVSPACAHCYADLVAQRYAGRKLWDTGEFRFFGDDHWRKPRALNRAAEAAGQPSFVFCASMADVFQEHPALEQPRERLFELIEETPWLVWLLLTKRPEAICDHWVEAPVNVWLGTSIENARFTYRAKLLTEVPAPVHFLSCEPLLGSLFDPRTSGQAPYTSQPVPARGPLDLTDIEWVIGGGESGPRFRQTNPDHARELRDACRDAGIPFFWKQWGGQWSKQHGKRLDGREWCQRPEPVSPRHLTLF